MPFSRSQAEVTVVPGRITVVIAVYNGGRFIGAAIDSVIAQEYRDLELIVIDDGSTDETASVVKAYGNSVRYVFQKNAGSSAARNQGCRLSTGEFLAFIDADDLWPEQKLSRQLEAFANDASLDLVWGHIIEFFDGEEPTASDRRPMAAEHPGTVLIRRDAFQRTGGFSEQYQQAEVVDWVTRILQMNLRQLMLPHVLMYRRLHDDNKGLQNADARRQYLQILKRHLDRKRS